VEKFVNERQSLAQKCAHTGFASSNAYSVTVRSCISHNRLTYHAKSTPQHVVEHASGDFSWS